MAPIGRQVSLEVTAEPSYKSTISNRHRLAKMRLAYQDSSITSNQPHLLVLCTATSDGDWLCTAAGAAYTLTRSLIGKSKRGLPASSSPSNCKTQPNQPKVRITMSTEIQEVFGQYAINVDGKVVMFPTEQEAAVALAEYQNGAEALALATEYAASQNLTDKNAKTKINLVVAFLNWVAAGKPAYVAPAVEEVAVEEVAVEVEGEDAISF